MTDGDHWICKRCGNRVEGEPTNLSKICWTCIEFVHRQPGSRPTNLVWKILGASTVFIILELTSFLLIDRFVRPSSNTLATILEYGSVTIVLVLVIGGAAIVRCPCCKRFSLNSEGCVPCSFEYQG